jgi:hypothetical protein
MRAATAIVGAIAVASILVALSLIVSGGGDSGQTVVTKTVVEKVEAPAPKETREEPVAEEEAGGGAQFGGPTQCDSEVSVENTSCEVGEQIYAGYAKGARGELSAKDAETGATVAFTCEGESAPITCRDEEGATVYFPP